MSDDELAATPFPRPPDDSPERLVKERRAALGGFLPARRRLTPPLQVPDMSIFDALSKDSKGRELSTTMAFVRMLSALIKNKAMGRHCVPIVADEGRTFGIEGLFRQVGIYSSVGQLCQPVDHDQLLYYREDKRGRCSRRGSPRPVRSPTGSPRGPRTPTTVCT